MLANKEFSNNLINKEIYNKDNDFSIFENSYEKEQIEDYYSSSYYSKPSNEEYKNENENNTEAPAPSIAISNNNVIQSKIYDCIELDKLFLIRSSFFYNNKINKSDFYKVTVGKNIEVNYQKIKQNKKKYDKYINNYRYNFVSLIDYTKEVIKQLKIRNKNKINFELKLTFKNDKKNNKYFEEQEKKYYYYNISCKYKFFYQDQNGNFPIKKKYKHINIFDDITQLTKINDILKEIEELLNKINDNKLNEEIMKENKVNNENKNKQINKINISKFKIISFQKCIAQHKSSVQMIRELPCGHFVSCGFDGQLFLYDENLNKIYSEQIIDNWIYSISEIPDNTKNKFMVCCPEKIFLLSVKDNKIDEENKRLTFKNSLNLYAFAIKENEIIICGNKCLTKYNGIIKEISKENKSIFALNNLYTTYGIKITDNIICVISNKVLHNGEDILQFINTNNKNQIISEEYSFNINQNSLLIINTNINIKNNNVTPDEPNKNNKSKKNKRKNKKEIKVQNNINEKAKLLFVACTKYYREQKNGILILCPNGKKIHENFYDTGDFEVFCFCLLDNNNKDDKNYIFVGGYDNNLNQGLIKLYEIIYDDNNRIEATKLKFIRNIYNLSKFKEPINCIIQSSKTGEIVVTSWDGTINLFSKPNLDNVI